MRHRPLIALLAVFTATTALCEDRPVTIEDSIAMTRILDGSNSEALGAFSADGRWFAYTTFRGDLAQNTNEHCIQLLDLGSSTALSRELQCWPYMGDSRNHNVPGIEALSFVDGDKGIAFLGRRDGQLPQLYRIDIGSGRVRQLTDSVEPISSAAFAQSARQWIYSVTVAGSEAAVRDRALQSTGVFLWDQSMFLRNDTRRAAPIIDLSPVYARRYYAGRAGARKFIRDSRTDVPTFAAEAIQLRRGYRTNVADDWFLGKFGALVAGATQPLAMIWPYHEAATRPDSAQFAFLRNRSASTAAQFGLVDLRSGSTRPLPGLLGMANQMPVMSPDGQYAVVTALRTSAPADSPRPLLVELATGAVTPLSLAPGWFVVSWTDANELFVMKSWGEVGIVRREGSGWGEVRPISLPPTFSKRWPVNSNGAIVVGVQEGLDSPPELVAYDLQTGSTRRASDLNPQLRSIQLAPARWIHWRHRYDENAQGILVAAADPAPVRRPLVIYLDDGNLRDGGTPYMLDGVLQLSGFATQLLASRGYAVLYLKRSFAKGAHECEIVREEVESAIDYLDQQQIADPARVGISGWSRAAYHVDCVLMRAEHRFAAASKMDGGGYEYVPGTRGPWTDEELRRIVTPILFEPHGFTSLYVESPMADRLRAMGRPSDILYLHTAPHSTLRPMHRHTSIARQLDWWEFWLKGKRDGDGSTPDVYRYWSELAEQQDAISKQPRAPLPQSLGVCDPLPTPPGAPVQCRPS